jgi:hypothetical protein
MLEGRRKGRRRIRQYLNENNIRISVFTANKKELLGTKVTENYMDIYNGN